MTRLDSAQLAQPPTFDMDLFHDGRMVGWLTPHAAGFRGFENENDAMHAAFFAHRALARQLARRDGRRPMPIGTEPLRLTRDDTVDASGRRIGTIVRPGVDSRSGADSYGFELSFAGPLDEVAARANFTHLYRALRRSGIRWAMWRSEQPRKQTRRFHMTQRDDETREQVPSLEPWLAVAFLACVPMTAAFILHADFLPYLLGFGGALTVTSFVMLARQERRKARERSAPGR